MRTTEINDLEKILIFGDTHGEFVDDRAYDLMINYNRKVYKPDTIVVNGDFVDFYSLSKFDKNPERKYNLQHEIDIANKKFAELRKSFPTAKIYVTKGNHEIRLQTYFYKHPELSGLDNLKFENLFNFKKNKIKFVDATSEYWKSDSGHLSLGDTVLMHGDNRSNGARGGKYAAYNTMLNINYNTVVNHTHKLSVNYYTNSYVDLFALNTGCLCQVPGMADFHQGFATFENVNGKGVNPRTYRINRNRLNSNMIIDGVKYTSKVKVKNKI